MVYFYVFMFILMLWFIHLALSENARRQSLKIQGFGVLMFLPSISHEQ